MASAQITWVSRVLINYTNLLTSVRTSKILVLGPQILRDKSRREEEALSVPRSTAVQVTPVVFAANLSGLPLVGNRNCKNYSYPRHGLFFFFLYGEAHNLKQCSNENTGNVFLLWNFCILGCKGGVVYADGYNGSCSPMGLEDIGLRGTVLNFGCFPTDAQSHKEDSHLLFCPCDCFDHFCWKVSGLSFLLQLESWTKWSITQSIIVFLFFIICSSLFLQCSLDVWKQGSELFPYTDRLFSLTTRNWGRNFCW